MDDNRKIKNQVQEHKLLGSWKLLSMVSEKISSGELMEDFGATFRSNIRNKTPNIIYQGSQEAFSACPSY